MRTARCGQREGITFKERKPSRAREKRSGKKKTNPAIFWGAGGNPLREGGGGGGHEVSA